MTNWPVIYQLVFLSTFVLGAIAAVGRALWMRPAERAEIARKAAEYEAEQAQQVIVYPITRD